MILELCNYVASKQIEDIRYSTPTSNDGSAAGTVLKDKDYANQVVFAKTVPGDDTVHIGDIVTFISNRMDNRITAKKSGKLPQG